MVLRYTEWSRDHAPSFDGDTRNLAFREAGR